MTILLLIIGLFFGLPTFSQTEPLPPITTDVKTFQCDGLTGFTFDYPVPSDWSVSVRPQTIPGNSPDHSCVMSWSSQTQEFFAPPTITITKTMTAPAMDLATALQNPHGITYTADATTHTYTFYSHFYGEGDGAVIVKANSFISAAGPDGPAFSTMLVDTFATP